MDPLQLPPAPNTPEALARESIDDQLLACGWVIQDYKAADLSAGRGIALREVPLTTGPCDYLLLVDRTPVGIIEAKKQGTTLSAVADQSARYANSLPDFLTASSTDALPFLYESTGVETLFRDTRDPDPRSRRIFTFHQPQTLGEWFAEGLETGALSPSKGSAHPTLRGRLRAMPTAHPLVDGGNDAANNGTGTLPAGMRECQIEAITGLEKSLAENRPRALIHMATGAGKTYTACAFTFRIRTRVTEQGGKDELDRRLVA